MRCSVKKVFLKISQNSRENAYIGVSFFNNVLLKKGLRHKCFPVNFEKIFKNSLYNTSDSCFFIYSLFELNLSKFFCAPITAYNSFKKCQQELSLVQKQVRLLKRRNKDLTSCYRSIKE